MASACKSSRDCERWRGLLREISRKWLKFKTLADLSDSEVRDLNDEINKLMRDKDIGRIRSSRLVAVTNYRRNVAMLDDDRKEVPGTKGYKYFGRTKELPGVRELFQSRKREDDKDSKALTFYKSSWHKGLSITVILVKTTCLLQFERQAENEDWEEACSNLRRALGLPTDRSTPGLPGQYPSSDPSHHGTKRKASDGDALSEDVKRLPTHDKMEAALLSLRKKALVKEYFGDGET
ncbi:Isy1-like splicing factor [Mycena galopus ATCC 62051]|nr:Isy1-like splicing factor [Mycena galopus ATCC 62051]